MKENEKLEATNTELVAEILELYSIITENDSNISMQEKESI